MTTLDLLNIKVDVYVGGNCKVHRFSTDIRELRLSLNEDFWYSRYGNYNFIVRNNEDAELVKKTFLENL